MASREQADYGHSGRFNAWESRRIDTRLQANVEELQTIAEALSSVVERGAEQRENGRSMLRERWHYPATLSRWVFARRCECWWSMRAAKRPISASEPPAKPSMM